MAKAKTSVVFVVAMALSVSGCQSAKPQRREPNAILQRTSTLYLASGPYGRIHVEIDVVEGAEPPQDAIDELAAFLETHCRKPVTVVADDVIAAEEAAGLDPAVVALQHIDGPPEGAEAEPAFMYILLYRGPEKRGIAGKVIPAYPCAAYIDMEALEGGWLRRGFRRDLLQSTLKHEAGHILGLCAGEDHGDRHHCDERDCLMKPASTASFTRALFGLPQRSQGRLCDKCLSELEEKRAHAADPGLSFHGPALVRQNDGYYVAFVPKVFTLGFDEADAAGRRDHVEDARRLVEYVRSQMPEEAPRALREPGRCLSQMTGDPRSLRLFAARKDAVERAAQDTNGSIRRMAETILENGEIQPPEPFSGADAAEWIILPDTQQAEDGDDDE